MATKKNNHASGEIVETPKYDEACRNNIATNEYRSVVEKRKRVPPVTWSMRWHNENRYVG